jgi:peptidoglycan/xylan/chitin deacetylase (PgdA/CDA1 family)/2-polyprenyl-3-methyl-5-hydroxy-6-metoxy-1,4-benzoquinol methylase
VPERCRGTHPKETFPDVTSREDVRFDFDRRDRRWTDLASFYLGLSIQVPTWLFIWDTMHLHPRRWKARFLGFLSRESRSRKARETDWPNVENDHFEQTWWNRFFTRPDPWGYTSVYEQTKYQQTLDLLPSESIINALEIGCAEGHFTVQLAPLVDNLLAVDISHVALERAKARCARFENVEFKVYNLWRNVLFGQFDLIVCSEILYFTSRFNLKRVIWRLARHLKPGGHILTAHANVVVDDSFQTGFNYEVGHGAQAIGRAFARSRMLIFVRELRTPLYRIQLFRRRKKGERLSPFAREVIEAETGGNLTGLAPSINWSGAVVTRREANHAWTTRQLPILMYHRIAEDGPAELAEFRVAPAQFERQLIYLKRHGYNSITLDQWFRSQRRGEAAFAGRAVILTFDDAYRDFFTTAYPLLRWHGFSATLLIATRFVGSQAEWDRTFGDPAALMSWDELKTLTAENIEFGSHAASHCDLTRIPLQEVVTELRESRTILETKLNRAVTVFCYPFGQNNDAIRSAVRSAGYDCALTTTPGLVAIGAHPLNLPRQEIKGGDTLDDFVAKLGLPERATLDRRLSYCISQWSRRNLMRPSAS